MKALDELLQIMAALRHPETGCPWDIDQDFDTVKPYTIEEAYEVADAIERNDIHDLKDELGDLLFQVVFHAQIAKEKGLFEFEDVVNSINEKLVRRHPHVFADEIVDSDESLAERWEQHKQEERKIKGQQAKRSALDGVAKALPALQWSLKLQKRAARTGFDWPDIAPVFDKLDEEVAELQEELKLKNNQQRILDEYGDVLFVVVNLGMHMGLSAEQALRYSNQKFISRFTTMEYLISKDGQSFEELSLVQMEEYWRKAKRQLETA